MFFVRPIINKGIPKKIKRELIFNKAKNIFEGTIKFSTYVHVIPKSNPHKIDKRTRSILFFKIFFIEIKFFVKLNLHFNHFLIKFLNMEFKRENLKFVPEKPGVYLFYDKKKRLLYVGKARNLRERIKTHMNMEYENPRLNLMIKKVSDFEFITTSSEPEALLLENNLIKAKKPKFNIRLRDDKKYPYLKITLNEIYPRIFTTRDLRDDGSVLIGPFHSAKSLRRALRMTLRIFPIRTCKYKLPSKRKINPCLEYELKRCPAPCVPGWVKPEEYKETVKKAIDFSWEERKVLRIIFQKK